ncbi:hypothetical protein Sango_2240700 [Sesamum angolense]|uniref:Retrotransposon gag domain-containing protein n=1 Tax=Sesamum angolense TaxID=2727404 RepID=A0AAE1W936_9LAMI|nr:hypothetical protein Sango_2240700 [Sesamum angolense]
MMMLGMSVLAMKPRLYYSSEHDVDDRLVFRKSIYTQELACSSTNVSLNGWRSLLLIYSFDVELPARMPDLKTFVFQRLWMEKVHLQEPQSITPTDQRAVISPGKSTLTTKNTGTYNSLNKMEFPYIDGEHARSLVRRCARYFQLIPISDDQKVPMDSMYMQGRAELWYQWYTEKREFQSWEELMISVLERFEDLDSEKVMTEFNKLHHESTVNVWRDFAGFSGEFFGRALE